MLQQWEKDIIYCIIYNNNYIYLATINKNDKIDNSCCYCIGALIQFVCLHCLSRIVAAAVDVDRYFCFSSQWFLFQLISKVTLRQWGIFGKLLLMLLRWRWHLVCVDAARLPFFAVCIGVIALLLLTGFFFFLLLLSTSTTVNHSCFSQWFSLIFFKKETF